MHDIAVALKKKSEKLKIFCILNIAILFSMVDLVVQVDLRLAKFANFLCVMGLRIFRRDGWASGRPTEFDKHRTFKCG